MIKVQSVTWSLLLGCQNIHYILNFQLVIELEQQDVKTKVQMYNQSKSNKRLQIFILVSFSFFQYSFLCSITFA